MQPHTWRALRPLLIGLGVGLLINLAILPLSDTDQLLVILALCLAMMIFCLVTLASLRRDLRAHRAVADDLERWMAERREGEDPGPTPR